MPATFDTVDKVADTMLAEAIGAGTRVVMVPFVNVALAARTPYRGAIGTLRAEGVRVWEGPDGGWLPHPAGTGDTRRYRFPWREGFGLATG